MTSITRWLLAALLMAGSLMAQGQTIVQDQGSGSATGPGVGQPFVTTLSGSITAIGVRSVNTTTAATLHIYTGAAGSGIPGAIGAPIYTQANVNLSRFANLNFGRPAPCNWCLRTGTPTRQAT